MSGLPKNGAAIAHRRLRLACAFFLVSTLCLASDSRRALALTPPGEYEVKAAFVANFAGFVHWPAAAFADAGAPFVVCVAGDDPFGAAFEPFRHGQVVGRPLIVQPASTAPLTRSCQILFVAESEGPRLTMLLGALGSAPILTVSDLEGFAANGGMIQLYLSSGKIRFEINRAAAEHAGLKVDARLLKLSAPARGAASEEGR